MPTVNSKSGREGFYTWNWLLGLLPGAESKRLGRSTQATCGNCLSPTVSMPRPPSFWGPRFRHWASDVPAMRPSGGVFESQNRGADWRPLNRGCAADFNPAPDPEYGHDPHCVVLHPLMPDRLYQQNHCGIYRMERAYLGMRFRIIDEQERIRPHIKIFVNRQLVPSLNVPPAANDEIHIICALSRG